MLLNGRWLLVGLAGRGAFSQVYQALDLENQNATVAIKVLHKSQAISSISSEVRAMKALPSNRFIHIIDTFIITIDGKHNLDVKGKDFKYLEGLVAIVMQWATRGTIRQCLDTLYSNPPKSNDLKQQSVGVKRRVVIGEPAIWWIAHEILSALKELHALGMSHCDMKASNVLLVNEHICLSDFGCVVLQDNSVDVFEREGGSPYWMPPEAFTHQKLPSSLLSKGDVWAVGCTLVECMTGLPPYGHLTPSQAIAAICHQVPPSLSELVDAPKISLKLSAFTQACLNDDPKSRPSAHSLYDRFFNNEQLSLLKKAKEAWDDLLEGLPSLSATLLENPGKKADGPKSAKNTLVSDWTSDSKTIQTAIIIDEAQHQSSYGDNTPLTVSPILAEYQKAPDNDKKIYATPALHHPKESVIEKVSDKDDEVLKLVKAKWSCSPHIVFPFCLDESNTFVFGERHKQTPHERSMSHSLDEKASFLKLDFSSA